MSNRDNERVKQEYLHTLAQEYEQEGYRVILQPDRSARPAFLAEHAPSMIALGASENAVVAVHLREDLIGNDTFLAMVAAVEATPGWRFDLALTPPAHPPVVEKGAVSLDAREIHARINSARELLAIGQSEIALVLAWSAVEASLRLLAEEHNLALDRYPSNVLIRDLIWYGLLDDDDAAFLREGLRFRNLIAHGYRAPEGGSAFASRLVERAETFGLVEPHSAA